MKLSKELLRDKLDLPYSAIEDTIIGQSRWSTQHEIIFEYERAYYKAFYSAGSTENQDKGPWEYDEEVECTPVRQVEKVVKVWEKIP